jgi:hypothetical protein
VENLKLSKTFFSNPKKLKIKLLRENKETSRKFKIQN